MFIRQQRLNVHIVKKGLAAERLKRLDNTIFFVIKTQMILMVYSQHFYVMDDYI